MILQKTVQVSLRAHELSSLCIHFCVPGACGQNAPRAGTPARPVTPSQALREYSDFAMSHDGNALRGKELFSSEQRTACVTCHSVDATSGKAGPDLFAVADKFPRSDMITAL